MMRLVPRKKALNTTTTLAALCNVVLSQGVADSASVDQAQQAVLNARNNLINYQTQRKTAEQTLRNLLNLKPEEAIKYQLPTHS